MLQIAICDDDTYFTGELENIIRQEAFPIALKVCTDVFFDGCTLKSAIQKGSRYDIIFLDIEMKKMNGIEVAQFIRKQDKTVLLIYISRYEQYLKSLFEVEPFRFLTKPLDKKIFSRYFWEGIKRIGEFKAYYQYKFNKEIQKVPIKDIVYFESRHRSVHIFLSNNNEKYFYGKLNEVEKELQETKHHFLRIHQSFLINYSYVRKLNFANVILSVNDTQDITLKISEYRQKSLRTQLYIIQNREELSNEHSNTYHD